MIPKNAVMMTTLITASLKNLARVKAALASVTMARANPARERVPMTMTTRANTARVTLMMAMMMARTMTTMMLARTTMK
jgi:hypothetical protein